MGQRYYKSDKNMMVKRSISPYFCRMGRKIKPQTLTGLTVVDVNNKGMGIAKHEGRVLFIAGVVPGDVIKATIYQKKRGYFMARLEAIERPSADRVPPVCDHFGICGGCKWQQLSYSAQLQFKEKEVAHNLAHIGKVSPVETHPILAAPEIYFYRNKMEFSFSNQRWLTTEEIGDKSLNIQRNGLGFHKPGMWDKVVDIQKCHLQADPSNDIRNFIRNHALNHQLTFFNPRAQEGFLRSLMIRTATTGDIMVLIQFFHEDKQNRVLLLNAIQEKFPQITALLYCINSKANDSIYDQEILAFSEQEFITEKMGKLQFKIGPKSFYQTNSRQAENLYALVKKIAQLQPEEIVYDLYTGTGTIAQYVADQCKKVIGIESVPEAIESAKENAVINHISNAFFEVGDMKDCFNSSFIERHGRAQVVITDPPRSGMHPKVVEQLLALAPERIVYVSCNSATQARDLALLKDTYTVEISQAVDLFPQTHHVENVVLLRHL